MTQYSFPNNATSSLLSNVGPTDTVIVLPSGDGARFPADVAGYSFMVTVEDDTGMVEIMECTHRAGDVLTVVRGREGTAAASFTSGATVECRVTAGILKYLDFILNGNKPNGPALLDADGFLVQAQWETVIKAYGDDQWNVKLGWTPVQAGGGTGHADPQPALKLGLLTAGGKFSLQSGATAPTQLLTRGAGDGTGIVVLTQDRMNCASTGVEDRITLGAKGDAYLFGRDVDFGAFCTSIGELWRFTYATKVFNVGGTITQGGTPVSVNGHTHTTAQVTGLDAALASKLPLAGGTIAGNLGVNGFISCAGAITGASVTDSSDVRIKRSITNMTPEDALDLVTRSRGVRFFNLATNRPDFGVVADEQLKVTPELIFENAAGMKSVAYQRMVAPLLVVVQNLIQRVTALEEAAK